MWTCISQSNSIAFISHLSQVVSLCSHGVALVLNKLIELVNVINTLHNSKLIVNIIGIDVNNPLIQLVSYAPCCLQYLLLALSTEVRV